jgi:hypothetical protein
VRNKLPGFQGEFKIRRRFFTPAPGRLHSRWLIKGLLNFYGREFDKILVLRFGEAAAADGD